MLPIHSRFVLRHHHESLGSRHSKRTGYEYKSDQPVPKAPERHGGTGESRALVGSSGVNHLDQSRETDPAWRIQRSKINRGAPARSSSHVPHQPTTGSEVGS